MSKSPPDKEYWHDSKGSTREKNQILVVDDDRISRQISSVMLTKLGHSAIEARNGEEALMLVDQHSVAGILLDVMMPGMDGFETCRRLKGNPTTAHIPIVLVTALIDASSRQKGFEAGADDFITKPVGLVKLGKILQQMVRANHPPEAK